MDEQTTFAVWTTAYINNLPDSAFLYIESGGSQDSDGKTEPRSLRHFPYRDANGNVDLPHLRNAIAQAPKWNLPASVKEQVQAKARKILAQQEQQTATPDGLERFVAGAPLTHVDVRDPSQNPDDTWTFSGYAAVYNQRAVVKNTRDYRVEYQIAPDAFAGVLRDQRITTGEGVVHFNLNHDMNRVVAASDVTAGQPGSLQLSNDAHGLHYLAKVSKDDPDGVALAVKMRDGVIRQASVAFVCANDQVEFSEQEDGSELALRQILDVAQLVDVCATPQGVFHQASSQLQQYAAAVFGHPALVGGHPRQPDLGGASTVNPDEMFGGGVAVSSDELAAMRRELAQLRK